MDDHSRGEQGGEEGRETAPTIDHGADQRDARADEEGGRVTTEIRRTGREGAIKRTCLNVVRRHGGYLEDQERRHPEEYKAQRGSFGQIGDTSFCLNRPVLELSIATLLIDKQPKI